MEGTNWTPESGLRAAYPAIPWDEPLPVEIGDPAQSSGVAFTCRYCVAKEGLWGIDVLNGTAGYGSYAEAREHILGVHGGSAEALVPTEEATMEDAGGRNLILSVHWEDGDPNDATTAMAARQAHAGHIRRGVVVSFAEATTAQPGFADTLARLDVGEILESRFRPSPTTEERR